MTSIPNRLLSVRDFAKWAGCSRRTVERLINSGHIRVVRLKRMVRIPSTELERIVGDKPDKS